jgi:uncharacterized delta-60 repeat protein
MPVAGPKTSGRRLAIVIALLGATAAHGAVGDLDASFGMGGKLVTQLGVGSSPSSDARGIAQDSDGRLLVAGAASDQFGRPALALARYLPGGAFDTSFGPGGSGVVVTQLGAGPTRSVHLNGHHAVVLAPDGGIIVCGQASDANGNAATIVARYTTDGVLDPSFASGGKFALQLSTRVPSGISGLFGCAVQTDGSVVGAGYRDSGSSPTFAVDAVVLRLDAHGVLDPGFASGGLFIQQLSLGSAPGSDATDVLVLPDGRILLSIEGRDASDNAAVGVARLTPSGGLDPDFGANGYTLVSIGSFATGLGRQADDRIVIVGGGTDAMGHNAMLAARFTAHGMPDPSFGDGGRRLVQPSAAATPQSGAIGGLAVQPSGKIVIVGDSIGTLDDTQLAIVRLSSDGSLDPSFGATGIVLRQFAGGSGAMTLGDGGLFTSDGKLLVVGKTFDGTVERWLVASFVADLPPTATFSVSPAAPVVEDGVTFDASTSSDPDGQVAAIAWDLNADGVYGDASGVMATASFASGGDHVVGIAVTDDDGVTATATATVNVGCGNAATFASVDCRLAALFGIVESGVPAGKVHDRLSAALTTARARVAEAAAASGRAARRALAKARHALAGFSGAVRAGRKDIAATLRRSLLAGAKGIRSAMGKLAASR